MRAYGRRLSLCALALTMSITTPASGAVVRHLGAGT